MRSYLVVLSLIALSAFTIAPALADPADDINQAIKAFAAVTSVHADISAPQGSGTLDEVQPNKARYSLNFMGRQMQLVRIGGDSWVNSTGQWRHSHYNQNPMFTQMDIAQKAILENKDIRDGYDVSDAGPVRVGRILAHKYHLVDKNDNSKSGDVILGPNHLPLQIVIDTRMGPMTYTYSQYNKVADITPPM